MVPQKQAPAVQPDPVTMHDIYERAPDRALRIALAHAQQALPTEDVTALLATFRAQRVVGRRWQLLSALFALTTALVTGLLASSLPHGGVLAVPAALACGYGLGVLFEAVTRWSRW